VTGHVRALKTPPARVASHAHRSKHPSHLRSYRQMQVQPVVQQPQPVKIYNAVYSSVQVRPHFAFLVISRHAYVQVYECMVRGIAVMRRRADSYVNATQILKVAGVDKGRRTKILEKEILPGKHEIVQGGYGKYQGTWSVKLLA